MFVFDYSRVTVKSGEHDEKVEVSKKLYEMCIFVCWLSFIHYDLCCFFKDKLYVATIANV